jgi:flavin-dependent dehydrogenase
VTRPPDVVVLGGGPAGAAASSLLATWGHAVHLVTRPAADHRLAVSVPPSTAKLFDAIGVSDAIDRAGFIRSTGNTVWWGGPDARIEPFAGVARGWQLEVDRLSQVLLDRAVASGVRTGAQAEDPVVPAPFTLDCTGRAGVIARAKHVRRYEDGPRTVALVGEWRRADRWPVPDDTHTLIESYDDGWMWSVPAANGIRHIAAMVDPRRSDLARGAAASGVYLGEINKTRVFKRLIDGATLQDGPKGWDATQYDAAEYAGDDWLLVGDAGSFIDPLSSAGVKKALASGWLAAIVVHTCLVAPSMRPHALGFFSAREREIAAHLSSESKRFLAAAASGHRHVFWDDRADEPIERHGEGLEIQRALDRLKGLDQTALRIGPRVAIEPRPCIRGHEIVLEPHLVSRSDPHGVRYVRGADVVALLEVAIAVRQVPDAYETYVNRMGPVTLPDFLFALATAVSRGWLVAE